MIKESISDALLFYWDELAYSPFRVFVTPSAPFALLTMLVPLKRATILLVCFGILSAMKLINVSSI